MTDHRSVRYRLTLVDESACMWRSDREGAVARLIQTINTEWGPDGFIDPLRAAIVLAQANAPETQEVRFTLKSHRSGQIFEYILDLRP